MTSCGDEAAILQFATSHWSAVKHEDPSPFSQFLPTSAAKQSAINNSEYDCKQQALAVTNTNVASEDNVALVALLRQRLGMCWQQFWQQHQQNANLKAQQQSYPVVSTMPTLVAEQKYTESKEIQQLANNAKQISYSPHIWANIAALAAKNQGFEADLSKLSYPYGKEQHHRENPKSVSPGLGNLLPPPPLLPVTTPSLYSSSSVASSTATSVSTSIDRQIAKSSDNQHNFEEHTSALSIDKSQPLDLTTSGKRSDADSPPSVNTNAIQSLSKTVMQNNLERNIEAASRANSTTSYSVLPSIYNLSFYSQSVPSSSSSLCNIKAPQVAAFAPYFQNTSSSVSQPDCGKPGDCSAPNSTPNQEYLQKWLLAAQQHHQVSVIQQSTKKRRKMTNSSSRLSKQRLSFHPYRIPSKDSSVIDNEVSELPLDPSRIPGSNASNKNSGKRYKRYAKPPYSYVSLITLSILSSPEKKLRLSQILKRISEMFPFFNGSYQGWRDSVRHNLSQNECFVKVLKNPFRPTAKGNYWTVNIAAIPHELLLRQNTLVSRYAQESGLNYRKDLSELFNLANGNVKIKIPERLFNGNDLIDDPAYVMEVLLLMDEKDDNPSSPSVHVDGKSYSLIDLFNQEDFVEEDLIRQSGGANRWTGKIRKAQTSPRSSPIHNSPVFPIPHFSQYNNIDSQKLAMDLVRRSNASAESNNAHIMAQKKLLAQVISSGQMSNYLPLLQSHYATSHFMNAPSTNILPPTLESQSSPGGFPLNKVADISDSDQQFSCNQKQDNEKLKSNYFAKLDGSCGDDNKPEMRITSNDSTAVDLIAQIVQSSPLLCPNDLEMNCVSAAEGQDSPVRSQASDLSTEILGSSPLGVSEELTVSPREQSAPPFITFTSCPLKMTKTT